MELKNYELIQYVNELKKYSDKKYPAKISYAIIKNFNIFSNELKNYNDCLAKIMESYKGHFVKDEDGNVTMSQNGIPVVQDEYMEPFIGEINQLLGESVTIDRYTISPDCFDYDDRGIYDVMTVNEMGILSEILCEEYV